MRKRELVYTVATYTVLCLGGAGSFMLPDRIAVTTAYADPAATGETLFLPGVVRRGAEVDLAPLKESLTRLGIRAELRRSRA